MTDSPPPAPTIPGQQMAFERCRFVERVVFSTHDSAVPVTITYPSPLKSHELDDLESFLQIWIKSQRRRSQKELP